MIHNKKYHMHIISNMLYEQIKGLVDLAKWSDHDVAAIKTHDGGISVRIDETGFVTFQTTPYLPSEFKNHNRITSAGLYQLSYIKDL